MNDNEKTTNEQVPAPEVVPMSVAAPVAAPAHQTNGLAIASLVLGILAFLSGWFFLGILLGIAAIVLGIMGMKKPGGKGMSIAGIITGSLGALSGLAFTAFWVIALVSGAALVGVSDRIITSDNQYESPTTTLEYKTGDTISFDSKEVKVTTVERGWDSGNEYSSPGTDKEFIKVSVALENKSNNEIPYNTFDWSVVDSDGLVTGTSYLTLFNLDGALESGSLIPGGKVSGSLIFEVKEGDQALTLRYEPSFWSDKKIEIAI